MISLSQVTHLQSQLSEAEQQAVSLEHITSKGLRQELQAVQSSLNASQSELASRSKSNQELANQQLGDLQRLLSEAKAKEVGLKANIQQESLRGDQVRGANEC